MRAMSIRFVDSKLVLRQCRFLVGCCFRFLGGIYKISSEFNFVFLKTFVSVRFLDFSTKGEKRKMGHPKGPTPPPPKFWFQTGQKNYVFSIARSTKSNVG